MNLTRCFHPGCSHVAVANPEIRVWATEIPIDERSAKNYSTLRMHRPYCERCTLKLTAADIITDEGWRFIVTCFARAGKITPVRSSAVVAWRQMSLGLRA